MTKKSPFLTQAHETDAFSADVLFAVICTSFAKILQDIRNTVYMLLQIQTRTPGIV